VDAVGRPDIAINTVGKVLKKPLMEISEAEYDEMAAVNGKSAFFFLKEAGRHVNDHGKIVTLVTSLLGAFTPFYSSYAAPRRRWSISRGRRPRSSARGASRSRPWGGPWTRRSSTARKARTPWPITRARRRCRRSRLRG
jgi:hypothetical protein